MIKSLFETNENQPDETKPATEKITAAAFEQNAAAPIAQINEPEESLEVFEKKFDALAVSEAQQSADEEMLAKLLAEIESETGNLSELRFDQIENSADRGESERLNSASGGETADETSTFASPAAAQTKETPPENNDAMLFQSSVPPESFAETARKSGLAYAAAITLFGSVVFMLIIGWFADLLLGSSPWGMVGGIVLGAAIGFFQFFRLTSQIFKNKE